MKRIHAFLALLLPTPLVLATGPTTGAYVSDTQAEYVADQVTEAIGSVNSILCYLASARADAMVNKGRYVAFVDVSRCDDAGRDAAVNSANDSPSSTQSFMRMSLASTRANAASAQVVKGHVALPAQAGAAAPDIYLAATASSAPAAGLPNGVLSLAYAGRSGGQAVLRGEIETSASGVLFAETSVDAGGAQRTARLYVSGTDTSGRGAVASDSASIVFGYNATHFCRRIAGAAGDSCFLRARAQASPSAWRYGVYDDATGARFDLANPALPVRADDGQWGGAGYWGVWMPGAFSDGQQVTGVDGATRYTIRKGGGRLVRYTRSAATLDRIARIPFQAHAVVAGAAGTYEMHWNPPDSTFRVTGRVACGDAGCVMVQAAATLRPADLAAATLGWGVSGWSAALGNLRIPAATLGAGTPGAQPVQYTTGQVVQPGDTTVPPLLKCVRDCPTRTLIAAMGPTASPYTVGTQGRYGGTPAGAEVAYTWDSSAYALRDPANGQVSADALPASLPAAYRWGLDMGNLVAATAVAPGGAMECTPTSGTYCDANAFQLPEYYRWEIGPHAWQRASFLRKADGSWVAFSPPQVAAFTVPSDATRYGSSAGAELNLQFMGFGQLQGIPGRCIDTATHQAADCGAGARHVPAFTIADDGFVTIGGVRKWVKWLDRELRLKPDATATAATLGITMGSAAGLPLALTLGGAVASDPSDASNTASYPGAFSPILFNLAPAVVHGVVQP